MSCHGGVRQQAGLSFLRRESALEALESGAHAIVPGSPGKSELINRIEETDPDLRMPPEGDALTQQEVSLLKKWINQGAEWEEHWSFSPPDTAIDPPTMDAPFVQNPVDAFVLERMEAEGFTPSPRADSTTLLRRLSLDLIGLPPREGWKEHLSDWTFEELVDTILASPHFGERWAAMWLDLARYADSQGYQKDPIRRTMWLYRDWVIRAFNENMPFDQFTLEQLGGDLLPEPTNDQLVATAFHRNTMTNDEGGTDDEEFRVAAVLDRVNTSFEVWQGVTFSCVQCHSHPYDPIDHREYYEAYALFNQTADRDHPRDEPRLPLYSPAEYQKHRRLGKDIDAAREAGDTVGAQYQSLVQAFLEIEPQRLPVMQRLPADTSRPTPIFIRGNWLAHGDLVEPGVPAALGKDEVKDRLDFAKWLVNPENPLTARVMVNRFWEQIFGIGLVESLEDFGTQGYPPSHPALLDWLAVQFSSDWDVKRLLKTIVMSSTYQQSSFIKDEVLKKDPYNRFLSRGPRIRLSAEQIRDQALAIAGLLKTDVYGPSVMPYQPEGVWNTIRHVARWETAENGFQHRRGLYTFWRRVSPYPSMIAFDSPSREFCVSRRIRTNTPIQALVTLNDPVFVEAADTLASHMSRIEGNLETQIAYGYERALGRLPEPEDVKTLSDLYQQTLIKSGSLERVQPHDHAMETVASVILNLDELITKS
ncbi:MAG: PSD1 and planctomycete cytochrome C domain-containing protein [Saprospiraceae bacterium]|nr:PSD1 and planctomycete cytochrome C domain-containing protein [Saprospiraceae bacterium]